MKPGVYDSLTNSEYHGGPGVSKSMLDIIANQSPHHLHYVRTTANDNEREPTPAQMLGTAFHCLLLEPDVFVREYCLGLRQADVPDAIGDRDTLVAMAEAYNAEQMLLAADTIKTRDELVARIAALNTTRLPKLPTSGSKAEVMERILALVEHAKSQAGDSAAPWYTAEQLDAMKAAELKAIIETENAKRPGLLSDKGTMAELAQLLRDAGQEIRLFSELCDDYSRQTGNDYLVDSKGSMAEIAAGLKAHGHQVTLWADVKAQWLANNGHRNVLDQEQWDQLHAMRDAVMAHPAASALMTMEGGAAERSVYWNDPATGELCRCRPDWWVMPRGIIVDVKTTEDASPEGFAKSIAGWRYHVQHPFYMDGINEMRRQVQDQDVGEEFPTALPPEVQHFLFLAVEKKAPHAVAVYALDDASVMLGRAQYRRDLGVYADCQATGVWPGYGAKIQSISVPQWHLNANAALLENVA